MSKKLDVIYFGDIKDINGVNLVTNLLLEGKEIFKKHEITLSKIYSSSVVTNCEFENKLPIGSNLGTTKYKLTRFLRTIVRKCMDSRVPYFAWYKFKKNFLIPAENVILKHHSKFDNDFILFQDIFTAYFYYKHSNVTNTKTILVLHCEEDVLAQFKLLYPGIFNSKYKHKIDEIFNFALNAVNKVIFVSEKAATFNCNCSYSSDFVYNGIADLDDIKLMPFKKNIYNFVCVGSVNYNKGQDVIIEAINILPENIKARCKFYFIGDGPQLPELKRSVKDYKLNELVSFLGLRKDVPHLLKNMDVLLLLSKTEGLPLSIIEGLRQGLYIVSTDVGGVTEMVKEDFGKLVQRNPNDLCEVLNKIVSENIINEESRYFAREHYLTYFTLNSMISKYCRILNSLSEDEN